MDEQTEQRRLLLWPAASDTGHLNDKDVCEVPLCLLYSEHPLTKSGRSLEHPSFALWEAA